MLQTTTLLKNRFILVVALLLGLNLSLLAQTSAERLETLKANAETALENKQIIRARDTYLRIFSTYSEMGDYAQAVTYGLKANEINISERAYKEAFDLFRSINSVIVLAEEKSKKPQPLLSYQLGSERLLLYQKLKRDSLANWQLNRMEGFAKQMNSDSIDKNLVVQKMSNSFTFGRYAEGEKYLQQLGSMQGSDDSQQMEGYYNQLFAAARQANNAAFTTQLYKQYIAWKDSVNHAAAEAKFQTLQSQYDEVNEILSQKEEKLTVKQWYIILLCIILGGALVLIILLFLARLSAAFKMKKMKRMVQVSDERNQRHTLFIANVTNEIEPSLKHLQNSASDISATSPDDAKAIIAESQALLKFLDHIKELSQLENSLNELYPTDTINLKDFFEELDAKTRPTIMSDVNLTFDTPKMQVSANKEHLEKVLLHLLRNAAIFTKEGNIRMEFKKRGAQTFQFILTDNGPGIAPELQENLFKPFNQASGNLVKGDKLGLPICYMMAVKMNGTLSLDSTYKRGCRFILELHT